MGIKGKTKGMSGELAPVLWAEGKREEVLATCPRTFARQWIWLGFARPVGSFVGSPGAGGFVVWLLEGDG